MGGDPAELAAALCARTGATRLGELGRRRGDARRVRGRRGRAAGARPHAPARGPRGAARALRRRALAGRRAQIFSSAIVFATNSDREQDGPAVQVALHQRAAGGTAGRADAERARHPRVLPRVEEDQEDQDDRDEDLQRPKAPFRTMAGASLEQRREALYARAVESEHAAVPQAEVAAPVGGARHRRRRAARPPVSAPMTAARVLALQRSAGNPAVTAMLQRQEKEKTPVAGPGTSGVSGGEPQVRGHGDRQARRRRGARGVARRQVPAGQGLAAGGQDARRLPELRLRAEPRHLHPRRRRTAAAATRPATSPPSRARAAAKAYDAVSDPNDDTKINKRVFPPFYWPPSTMNDDNVGRQPGRDGPGCRTTSRGSRSWPRRTTGG